MYLSLTIIRFKQISAFNTSPYGIVYNNDIILCQRTLIIQINVLSEMARPTVIEFELSQLKNVKENV